MQSLEKATHMAAKIKQTKKRTDQLTVMHFQSQSRFSLKVSGVGLVTTFFIITQSF